MIHIALVTDARCVVPAAVTLASIARHANAKALVSAHLFVDRVDPGDVDRLVRDPILRPLELEVRPVEPDRCRGLRSDIPHITLTTFQRLFLDEYLPDLKRVIYLDVDVLVRSSLQSLWEWELGEWTAAGVRDGSIPFLSAPGSVDDWRALGAAPTALYCNTGVMVMDLVKWREEGMAGRILEYLQERDGLVRMADQGAINAALSGRWGCLPPTWNVQTEFFDPNNLVEPFLDPATFHGIVEDPAIVHFTGPAKPWMDDCRHPFAEEWQETLSCTSFAGWTCPEPEPARPRLSLVGRVRKAGRVLLRG